MTQTSYQQHPILVVGSCKLTSSIVVCLLQAGHRITLYSDDCQAVKARVEIHRAAIDQLALPHAAWTDCQELNQLEGHLEHSLVIAVTPENVARKETLIRQLEAILSPDALIAINTESIPLGTLQQQASQPERIIGLNWTEPAHTTLFLEIVTTRQNSAHLADALYETARSDWQKDPYVVRNGCGIRTRMLSAMLREAFYLIENGYVSIEGIDRGCRNDAGYYMPFAGNFRYMDLMGTFIYGLVMQDLNPELSKSRQVPHFFQELIQQGSLGMDSGKGFFDYLPGEPAHWDAQLQQFSYQIAELMSKYPFNGQETEELTGAQSLVHDE